MWKHPSVSQVKKLKKRYKDMYNHVEQLVNAWDPIGLIKGGAPKDEYNCISVQLISLLTQSKNADEIYEFIVHELDDHFIMGIDSVNEDYREHFINKHKKFSNSLIDWYKDYKRN